MSNPSGYENDDDRGVSPTKELRPCSADASSCTLLRIEATRLRTELAAIAATTSRRRTPSSKQRKVVGRNRRFIVRKDASISVADR